MNDNNNSWLKYAGLTAQLLVMLAVAVYGGIKLDERLHITPLLTCVFPLFVLVATFYKLIKEVNKKKDNNE